MASSASCSAPSFYVKPTEELRILSLASSSNINLNLLSDHHVPRNSSTCSKNLLSVIAKAAKDDQNKKPNSMICADCDGNGWICTCEHKYDVSVRFTRCGAVQCSQCKGSGVNAVDVFNRKFKAGDSCWLCG